MTRSEELWTDIEKTIAEEKLISKDQIDNVRKLVLSGGVSVDDWMMAIENSMLMEDKDGE